MSVEVFLIHEFSCVNEYMVIVIILVSDFFFLTGQNMWPSHKKINSVLEKRGIRLIKEEQVISFAFSLFRIHDFLDSRLPPFQV